ncbi:RloB family protein [Halomonas citrativorans]|uniref:RloB family protein n=1 Tax=Halomonas citrativorans TaxID=2742612 RepID=UPI000B356287|nr:RloB family protein [Halomonas citrativorans]
MGQDNLHHKRKARSAKQLNRKKAKRDPYSKILIVCEGKKTEPNYFEEIQKCYELNTANVELIGTGSSPRNILEYARQRYREEKDSGDGFDKVFCVFDRDSHTTYDETVGNINQAVPKSTFVAITSVPSFEYWLLMHFIYSTKPYENLSGNTAANQVLDEVKAYYSEYTKGGKDVFAHLFEALPSAKANAKRSLEEAIRNDNFNPSTKVHELVDFLQNIKK